MLLLGNAWSASEVAAALLIDDDTVRNHFRRNRQGGITVLERMNCVAREALLTSAQLAESDAHLKQHLHPTAASVARWIAERFEVGYPDSGMTAIPYRLGYRYKKPTLGPGKAPAAEVPEDLVASRRKFKESRGEHGVILFMDAIDPRTIRCSVAAGSSAGAAFPSRATPGGDA